MKTHTSLVNMLLLVVLSVLSYAQAPVPFVNQPLVPDATAPDGPQFTLTVNGSGFVSNSVVNWNGNALATQFVSGSQLTATVPAANIATASTASVTVVNPPPGGGTSNAVFFPVALSTGNSVVFGTSSFSLGNTKFVVVGDFNGDGILDLAIAIYGGGWWGHRVRILLGDGTGNFTFASETSLVDEPWGMAVGDFNGDGKLDLAVADYGGGVGSSTVSILLGDGAGNFTLASNLTAGQGPASVAVGDFNGDGNLDLAVSNLGYSWGWGGDTVSVFLGDGTGNFTPASSLAAAPGNVSVVVGDFNGDGKLDLAVATDSNLIFIMLGDGTGNFALASTPAGGGGGGPGSLVAADFNGDGKLDLAVTDCGFYDGTTVSILLGDGTGNFTLASSPTVASGVYELAVGDFNGDGKPDLAVANWSGSVSILLGDGTGNFTLASSLPVADSANSLAVGDFNGDGKLDLAVPTGSWAGGATVSILMGTPYGPAVGLSPASLTFGPQVFGTSSPPQPVTLTNIGSAPLDITKGRISWNFSQTNNCPRELAPGGQCTANVVFTPQNINTINGTMSIYDNAPNSPQTILLTGIGTAVTLLPPSLDFGDQQVGTTSQPQVVTLTNYAPKAVTIFGADLTGSNSGAFVVQGSTCGRSLPAGQSCTANIAFRPRATGPKNATFSVNDNAGVSPQIVALSGTGTP